MLKALRRADQPQFTPHMPLMGLPVSQEEEPNRRWIWWALVPLALVMGAPPTMAGTSITSNPWNSRSK